MRGRLLHKFHQIHSVRDVAYRYIYLLTDDDMGVDISVRRVLLNIDVVMNLTTLIENEVRIRTKGLDGHQGISLGSFYLKMHWPQFSGSTPKRGHG